MTVDERARQAATAIHAAVARVEPRPLPTRRRRWLLRATVGAIVAGLVSPAGVAVINAGRDGGEKTGVIVDDSQTRVDADLRPPGPVTEADTTSPAKVALRSDDAGAVAERREPSTVTSAARRVHEGGVEEAFRNCIPVITDPRGDVDNPAIDIVESSTTYFPSRNTLVIRHVIDDIPDTAPFPNEALAYEYHFTIDGTWYMAMSYIGPATFNNWYFAVQRYDRRRSNEWPNVPRREVMHTDGRVDTRAETVEVEINLDDFNNGERRVSDEEGLPPAAELRRGSRLTSVSLWAYPRSAGAGPFDRASGCDYLVE